MDALLTVATVLWVGEFRGRRYSPDWVRRTQRMVARNLSRPHRFVCLSNVEIDGVEVIPLRTDWPGWWAKLELFAHDFGGPVLYLDLDALIVQSLDPLADRIGSGCFHAMPSSYVFTGGTPAGGAGIVDRYQTSCMGWHGNFRWIYDEARRRDLSRYRGDQDFISDMVRDGHRFPARWFQKLRHCQSGPGSDHILILSMPWKCDEASKRFEWVRDVWQ